MVSLEAVGADFLGSLAHWPAALRQLAQTKKISEQDAHQGTLQWDFGCLIANSDMHAGNLSFFMDGDRLMLTPAYDMLPMALAPNSLGQMRDNVTFRVDTTLTCAVWQLASVMAKTYWQAVINEETFSEAFRTIVC